MAKNMGWTGCINQGIAYVSYYTYAAVRYLSIKMWSAPGGEKVLQLSP